MRPIIYDGAEISVAHLAPMSFPCPCADIGRDLVIGAAFSNHCYTESFDEQIHTRKQIVVYDAGSRPRVFCPIRHGLSHGLPEVVASLPGKRVHQTAEKRNYVYAAPMEVAGQIYEIFFMIQRAEKSDDMDLRLTVESAYPVSVPLVLPRRPNSIRFSVLAFKTLRREEIRFAPR